MQHAAEHDALPALAGNPGPQLDTDTIAAIVTGELIVLMSHESMPLMLTLLSSSTVCLCCAVLSIGKLLLRQALEGNAVMCARAADQHMPSIRPMPEI